MTIRHKEIRIQLPQIQRNLPDPMRPINTAQDPQPSTLLRQSLKGEPHPRHCTDGIKDGDFSFQSILLKTSDRFDKPLDNLPMLAWKVVTGNFLGADVRVRLQDRSDRLLARAIDGVEIDDHVARFVDEVAEDGVDPQGGILDENAGV